MDTLTREFTHADFSPSPAKSFPEFGGYEQVTLKANPIPGTTFYRKSVKANDVTSYTNLSAWKEAMFKNQKYGTGYPIYDYQGQKWALISISDA